MTSASGTTSGPCNQTLLPAPPTHRRYPPPTDHMATTWPHHINSSWRTASSRERGAIGWSTSGRCRLRSCRSHLSSTAGLLVLVPLRAYRKSTRRRECSSRHKVLGSMPPAKRGARDYIVPRLNFLPQCAPPRRERAPEENSITVVARSTLVLLSEFPHVHMRGSALRTRTAAGSQDHDPRRSSAGTSTCSLVDPRPTPFANIRRRGSSRRDLPRSTTAAG